MDWQDKKRELRKCRCEIEWDGGKGKKIWEIMESDNILEQKERERRRGEGSRQTERVKRVKNS